MPPPYEDEEPLEELDDDAIVAQQAIAHAPAPRVQVAQDARSIVVDQPPGEAGDTTRLRAMPRRPADPTLVLRAVRHPISRAVPPSFPVQPRPMPSWLPWVVWIVAGIVALIFGGVLAVLANRRDAPPVPATTSQSHSTKTTISE